MASRRDIQAGAAFIELYVRSEALISGLATAQGYLRSFGQGVMALGMRIGALGAVFTAPFAMAVGAASNLLGVMNKFGVVFGEHAGDVKKWSDSFAEHIGRSKRQIAQFLARMQTLFVPLGFDEATATRMSKQVTQLAVDLASFNNVADADVIRDLDAALTGSGRVMKKYHVILNEAAVKQELFNRGMDPKNATDQQKVMARLAIIMRATATAQGHAARNTGEYANQKKALTGRIEDLRGALAGGLLPELAGYYGWITKLAGGMAKWVKENQAVVISVARAAAGLTAAGAVIVGAGVAIKGMASVLGAVSLMVLGVTTAFSLAGAVIGAVVSPIGLVVVAMTGLVAYFLHAKGSIGAIVDWLGGVFGQLKEDATKAFGGIADALRAEDIKLAAKILWAFLKLEWQKGVNGLMGYWEDFKQFFRDMGITQAFVEMVAKVRTLWVNLMGFLQKAWLEFKASTFTETVAGAIATSGVGAGRVSIGFSQDHGPTPEEIRQQLSGAGGVMEQRRKELAGSLARIEEERKAALAGIERDRRDARGGLDDPAKYAAARKAREEAARRALAKAQADMDALVREARGKAAAKGSGFPGLEGPPGLGDGVPTAAEIKRTAVGTFSAAQAELFGGQNPQQQLVLLAKKQLTTAETQVEVNKNMVKEQKRLTLEATA